MTKSKMADSKSIKKRLFEGLNALSKDAFPKKCCSCGRIFKSKEDFIKETRDLRSSTTGLKEGEDDDGTKIVEVFRNCPCGSTLMAFFGDRRDLSKTGIMRRKRFREIYSQLCDEGIDPERARSELLKFLKGERSELIEEVLQ